MARATSRVTLTADLWTEIATGPCDVLVQRISAVTIEIAVAAAAPVAGSSIGHNLTHVEPSISFGMLATGEKIFAKAIGQAATLAVTK